MSEIVNRVQDVMEQIVILIQQSNPFVSFIFGSLLIMLESIIPVLPLSLFIAMNIVVFGNIFGFFISWVSTIIGCSISFIFVRKYIRNKILNKKKFKKLMDKISSFSFSTIVLILALPFTPAFAINIAAALSDISYKKYLFALIISKISIVYFWGYIGSTFVESLTDISVIVKIIVLLLITYILSHIVIKKFDMK